MKGELKKSSRRNPVRVRSSDEEVGAPVPSGMDQLSHPRDSPEFLQHMLCQTKRVDNLKRFLKKISVVMGVVSLILIVINLRAFIWPHSFNINKENSRVLVKSSEKHGDLGSITLE